MTIPVEKSINPKKFGFDKIIGVLFLVLLGLGIPVVYQNYKNRTTLSHTETHSCRIMGRDYTKVVVVDNKTGERLSGFDNDLKGNPGKYDRFIGREVPVVIQFFRNNRVEPPQLFHAPAPDLTTQVSKHLGI